MTYANVSADQIVLFLAVFVRLLAMIALLPVFGSQNAPVQLKVIFAFALALILHPLVAQHGPIDFAFSVPLFALLVIKEIFVGLLIGFGATFLFTAIQFAGRLIDIQIGFAFVQLVDPFTNTTVTTMGQLKILVFTLFFLLINGHYFFVLAMQKSFEVIPLFGAHLPGGKLAYVLTTMVGGIFEAALKLSAPVFLTLVLTSISMGIIARTVPQIHVFFVGFPLKIALGLGTTAIALPILADMFKKMVNVLMQDIWKMLHLIA
ncbi:MAG: flagellar biosynthetic protein FliR [Chitinivibrionales bacterium]|nr:flagellar biosynthetic protein FliR [Chitinivibrionales bacterium]